MHHAAARVAQDVELTVAIFELEGDGTGNLGGSASDLCLLELDPVWDIYPHAMRLPGRGTDNRPGCGFQDATSNPLQCP